MLRLYRGYPGSGKTTLAQAWVAEDETNRCRVNRDDLRFMTFGRYTNVDEMEITRAQKALVETHLRNRRDVAIDDTNLKLRVVKNWANLARRHGHAFEVVDVETETWECIQRDMARAERGERHVGMDVIKSFAQRYPMLWPEYKDEGADIKFLPVVRDPFLQPAIIVDLDGTLALHDGRSPYDYSKVLTDKVNWPVHRVVDALASDTGIDAATVIFLSGRPDTAQEDTRKWLLRDGLAAGWDFRLFMRPAGDDRADYVVKYEIFDREIRNYYDVGLVLDDRDQVVDMWRSIGLPTFQVNRGDF